MPAYVNSDDCVGCGICVDECPQEAISMKDGKAVVDPDMCVGCGACVDACPNSAISMK